MSTPWDRKAASSVLADAEQNGGYTHTQLLDALEACMRPALPRGIDRDALQSARRRIAVLYMAGSGGEAAALDLRLAVDELDAVLASAAVADLVLPRADFPAVHEVLWHGLLPDVPLGDDPRVRLVGERLLARLAERLEAAS